MYSEIKRFSFPKIKFSMPDDVSVHRNFTLKFNVPFIIGSSLVIGIQTKAKRSNRTGCILINDLSSILVQRYVKGKLVSWVYDTPIRELSYEERNDFWQIFKSKEEFLVYDKIQFNVAKGLLNEYGAYLPENLAYCTYNNTHYSGLRENSSREREERRYQARNRILEVQGEWFKDDNMSGVFDSLMSHTPKRVILNDVEELIKAKRLEVSKINNYLATAHKYEATYIEKVDKRKLEQEIFMLEKSLKG